MIKNESEKSVENVCDFTYLDKIMNGKKHLIKEVIDAFLKQVPEELRTINDAIINKDYVIIKNVAHTMRSSVSILGITILAPILKEIEDISTPLATSVEKIKELTHELNLICKQAIDEIKREEYNYA